MLLESLRPDMGQRVRYFPDNFEVTTSFSLEIAKILDNEQIQIDALSDKSQAKFAIKDPKQFIIEFQNRYPESDFLAHVQIEQNPRFKTDNLYHCSNVSYSCIETNKSKTQKYEVPKKNTYILCPLCDPWLNKAKAGSAERSLPKFYDTLHSEYDHHMNQVHGVHRSGKRVATPFIGLSKTPLPQADSNDYKLCCICPYAELESKKPCLETFKLNMNDKDGIPFKTYLRHVEMCHYSTRFKNKNLKTHKYETQLENGDENHFVPLFIDEYNKTLKSLCDTAEVSTNPVVMSKALFEVYQEIYRDQSVIKKGNRDESMSRQQQEPQPSNVISQPMIDRFDQVLMDTQNFCLEPQQLESLSSALSTPPTCTPPNTPLSSAKSSAERLQEFQNTIADFPQQSREALLKQFLEEERKMVEREKQKREAIEQKFASLVDEITDINNVNGVDLNVNTEEFYDTEAAVDFGLVASFDSIPAPQLPYSSTKRGLDESEDSILPNNKRHQPESPDQSINSTASGLEAFLIDDILLTATDEASFLYTQPDLKQQEPELQENLVGMVNTRIDTDATNEEMALGEFSSLFEEPEELQFVDPEADTSLDTFFF